MTAPSTPAHDRRPAFADLPLPRRAPKPRSVGITMTVEFGVGLAAQRDYLDLAGDTLDYAKQVVSTAGFMPEDVLRAKIEAYSAAGVRAFPGGMFLEFASAEGCVDAYLAAAARVGYRTVEVSENARPLDPATRLDLVARALDAGFEVLGEVGSKHVRTSIAALVDGTETLVDAGCSYVLVEAAELLRDGMLDEALVGRLVATGLVDRCVFELPGHWIPGTHQHDVTALGMRLLDLLGPDVNIANDPWGNSLYLETCRAQVGANLFEPGASALAGSGVTHVGA